MGTVLLLIWSISSLLFLAGALRAFFQLGKANATTNTSYSRLPVSILKPVCGVEDGLKRNLESFFHLDYPKYELVFSIADHRDPACQVVRELIAKYPKIDASLTVADLRIGENPKINNLFLAYRNSKYDSILISDSNIRVAPDYLASIVPLLKEGVGLVTAAISGRGMRGLGAEMEATYLSSYLMRWMHLSVLLRNPLVMGKSMLFRKRDLAKMGGIDALKCFIAEDYATGVMLRRLGLKVVHASQPVQQYLGVFSLKQYWDRHVRWGRIRQSCEFFVFLSEPLSSGIVSGLTGALGAYLAFNAPIGWFFAIHLVLWAIGDGFLLFRNDRELNGRTLLSWLLVELLTLPIWICVLCGNTVFWRGNRLALIKGGKLESPMYAFQSEPTHMNMVQGGPSEAEVTPLKEIQVK